MTGPVIPAADYTIATPTGDKPALEVLKDGHYQRQFVTDPEKSEYFVPVKWLQTVPLDQAVQNWGSTSNQNTVCKPTTPKWRFTIDRLKQRFPNYDK